MLIVAIGPDQFRLVGRTEELVALAIAFRDSINRMRAGSVEYHFGAGAGGSLWLHDRLTETGSPPTSPH